MLNIFVVHHSKNDVLDLSVNIINLGGKILPSRKIVTRITDDKRCFSQLLPSTSQPCQLTYMPETVSDCFVADGHRLSQDVECCKNGLSVTFLIGTFQFHIYLHSRVFILCKENRRMAFSGNLLKNRTGLFDVFTDNYRHVRLYDSCLLASYLCQGVSQKLGMVKTDIGNDRKNRSDDIGTVKSSSKSYFDYRIVYFLLGKVLECHGRGQLEERRMKRFEESTVLFYKVDDILFRQAFSVHTDALAEINKMRGCV